MTWLRARDHKVLQELSSRPHSKIPHVHHTRATITVIMICREMMAEDIYMKDVDVPNSQRTASLNSVSLSHSTHVQIVQNLRWTNREVAEYKLHKSLHDSV